MPEISNANIYVSMEDAAGRIIAGGPEHFLANMQARAAIGDNWESEVIPFDTDLELQTDSPGHVHFIRAGSACTAGGDVLRWRNNVGGEPIYTSNSRQSPPFSRDRGDSLVRVGDEIRLVGYLREPVQMPRPTTPPRERPPSPASVVIPADTQLSIRESAASPTFVVRAEDVCTMDGERLTFAHNRVGEIIYRRDGAAGTIRRIGRLAATVAGPFSLAAFTNPDPASVTIPTRTRLAIRAGWEIQHWSAGACCNSEGRPLTYADNRVGQRIYEMADGLLTLRGELVELVPQPWTVSLSGELTNGNMDAAADAAFGRRPVRSRRRATRVQAPPAGCPEFLPGIFGLENIVRAAEISDCGKYRYWLMREFPESLGEPRTQEPSILFVMLNPSTADENSEDRTLKRCISFAKAGGFNRLEIVNLFAYRATDPAELRTAYERGGLVEACGPENGDAIMEAVDACRVICAAWGGTFADSFASARACDFTLMASRMGRKLVCLGTTEQGHPRHPLFVPGRTTLQPFEAAALVE